MGLMDTEGHFYADRKMLEWWFRWHSLVDGFKWKINKGEFTDQYLITET